MYLRISPELYLKRLVVGNMGPVFEFARNFRNEGMDRFYNPEFTAVELYRPYTDYNWFMTMAEESFERIVVDLHGTTKVKFDGNEIDFKSPWRRITVYDGLREAYGIEPGTISDDSLKVLAAKEEIGPRHSRRGDIMLALFEKRLTLQLTQPTFVLDYPKETSPLAKQHRSNPNLAERFEGVIAGIKVMNGYTELNDPRDQRERFQQEASRKRAGHDEAMVHDEDFLRAMAYGMPPMGGLGIGVDRMAMILTNTPHIRDIILFPPVKNRTY